MGRPIIIMALALVIGSLAPQPVGAYGSQYATIVIDSLTTQPVGTGMLAGGDVYTFIVLTEGAVRTPGLDYGYTNRWFDPAGETRKNVAGQPIDEIPNGALLGTFGPTLSTGFYLPDQIDFTTTAGELGDELKLGLNVSEETLSTLEGMVVVHVLLTNDPDLEVSNFSILQSTALPVSTGLIAAQGDQFLCIARGAIGIPGVSGALTPGWFGPEGIGRVHHAGQLLNEAPFGCLLGSFHPNFAGPFAMADGGAFDAQQSDLGDELLIGLNMSSDDHSTMLGALRVSVIRIPDNPLAGVEPPFETDGTANLLSPAAPNPSTGSTRVVFSNPREGRVVLRIYDMSGRWVRTLVDEVRSAGQHQIAWDGRDNDGRAVASGRYFYQLNLRDHSETGRVTLVR